MDTFYDDDVARQVQREIELAVALRRASAYNLAARLPRLAPEQLDGYCQVEGKGHRRAILAA